ncbi:PhzF family phenazine biosynthesis protein [Nocardiopsis arvandica]|uniref:PhzF family phenazine biosynthesis protein n=1 Tax=Nocardiopsis sinuspersici TaxID=501010 RepID=A0A7Z0BMA9_9ACTN|nr:PhzF family phenazine biosynthesis protein [Nocardiopsis sinuspersici]
MPEYRVVDAFTDRPLAGNPAAVLVMDEDYSDGWAQGVAAEFNLSETAFARPVDEEGADYELRWFTPTVEIDLCGHATLATAHTLAERGVPGPYRFTTRSGLLTVTERDGRLWMDFPAEPPKRTEAPEGLARALGARPLWVGLGGEEDLLVELADEDAVRGLAPDTAALARMPYHLVIVTARADGGPDFVSRVFAPAIGVPEDPVTGRAHTVLTPFWARRLGRSALTAHQASARGGDLLLEDRGERVLIGGEAVSVATGTLHLRVGRDQREEPSAERWTTKEEIVAARERLEAAHPGWRRPAAYGVGLVREGETVFELANEGGGYLPAVVLARAVGHRSGTASHPLPTRRLEAAVAELAPAEACTELEHPNLHHWRELLGRVADGGGELVAVFVDDPADGPVDDHDRALRVALEG